MAEYKYPDPDDRLTVALIDEEYDGKEWEKSEQQILKKSSRRDFRTGGKSPGAPAF